MNRRSHLRQGIGLNKERNIKRDDVASYKALSLTSSVRKDEVGSTRDFTLVLVTAHTARHSRKESIWHIYLFSEMLASCFGQTYR